MHSRYPAGVFPPGGNPSGVSVGAISPGQSDTNTRLMELHNGKLIHNQCFIQCGTMGVGLNIHVRCKILENVPKGGGFSTAKSDMLSYGQIHVHKQRTCIIWVTSTPPMVSKRAHLFVGSSNSLTCPLRHFGKCGIFNGKVRNYAIQRTNTSALAMHMRWIHCV